MINNNNNNNNKNDNNNVIFEIKTLDQIDKDLFTSLWNESHLDHYHNWEKSKDEIYKRNKIFNVSDKLSKVAVLKDGDSNGKLIGFILNAIGDLNSKRVGWNAATAIIKEYRCMGIATKLYKSILEDFKENGIEEAVLELISINERAFKLYSKLGFKITSNHTILNSILDPQILQFNQNNNSASDLIKFKPVSTHNEYHLKNQCPTTQFQNLLMHNFNLVNIINDDGSSSDGDNQLVGYMYYSLSYDKKSIIFHQLYLNNNSLITDSTFKSIFNYFYSNYGQLNLVIYCWNLDHQITKFIIDYNNNQFKKSFDYYTMKLNLNKV